MLLGIIACARVVNGQDNVLLICSSVNVMMDFENLLKPLYNFMCGFKER